MAHQHWVAAVLLALPNVYAVSLLSNKTAPQGLSTKCTSALLANVDCDPVIPAFQLGQYYSNTTLERSCTSTCARSLTAYRQNIDTACANDLWLGYQNQTMPVSMIASLFQFNYDKACLTNNGVFCNNVAAAFAAAADPDLNKRTPPAGGFFGNISAPDACDLCLVKNLKIQAESPFYNGPELLSQSIYESKTSSCSVTGLPLTPTSLTTYTPTNTAPTSTPSCTNRVYTIQPGDDCHSISISQGIGTSWLLQNNGLRSGCNEFPKSGQLCLIDTCTTYTVVANDTCSKVARSHNVTEAQLKAWNPSIGAGCYNINQMIGDQLCVSVPGRPYVAPAQVTLAPSNPITAAPTPTDVAAGSNKTCGQFYKVIKGDFCNQLVLKFGISLADFVFLNPAINANCTNLFADESYCVAAVGDINTYPGRPGVVTFTPTLGDLVGDPMTRWPSPKYTPSTTTSTGPPLATDTNPDCEQYFKGSTYIGKGTGKISFKSDCDYVAKLFMVSLQDLSVWNPALGNTTSTSCTFQSDRQYCAKYHLGSAPPGPADAGSASPIRDGTTGNCTKYMDVFADSGYTCQDVLSNNNITIAEFYAWNPAVKADCTGLWSGYSYCVAGPTIPGSPTTTTSSTRPGPTDGAPTQSGQPSNCNKWYTVKSGDSCPAVENAAFITPEQFLAWNPAVSSDCTTGFWLGYAYCVGTTDTVSQTRSLPPSTSATATPTPSIPNPHQENNAASNCNKFAQAKDGEYCFIFAQNNGITTAQLYAWNAVFKPDGSGCANSFWLGYWYCVGVSS